MAAFGEHLYRTRVADVLLSDADVVALTHIIEQGSDFLRFRIPRSVAPGRYSVLLAAAEQQPALLDQPVVITVKRGLMNFGPRPERYPPAVLIFPPSYTGTSRGFCLVSATGMETSRMPLVNSAEILSSVAPSGSGIER